jgi:drug/metabolite transporter (DMT)-like permease
VRRRGLAYFVLALGVFGIGWSAIFVRLSGLPGTSSALYRMAFAQIVFVPWWFAARRLSSHTPGRSRDDLRRARTPMLLAGLLFAADIALFNSAVMATSAANATLLSTNTPIFVAFGGWLLYRRRPAGTFWWGLLLSVAGVLAIVSVDLRQHLSLGYGDALAVAGAICYAAYILCVERARAAVDALSFAMVSGIVAAITLLAICLVMRLPLHGWTGRTWAARGGLTLRSQGIGQLWVAYSLGKLPVAATSVMLLAQAPLTALLAVPTLGEHLAAVQIVGGLLVLAGVYVVNRRAAPREREIPVVIE